MTEKKNLLKLYDNRTYRRYVEQGLIQEKDYQAFLKSLPDEAANADYVSAEELAREEEKIDLSDDDDDFLSDLPDDDPEPDQAA